MTTQPMEALKPERPFERHDLGNGWYVERSGQHSTTWWIGHPDKSTEAIWKIDASYTMGEFRDFIAAMNTRPATDGLREAVQYSLAYYRDGAAKDNGILKTDRDAVVAALEDILKWNPAATPQAEAAPQFGGMASLVPIKGEGLPYPENFPPPVLASDATLDELLSDAATDAAYAAWEKRENAKGINTWNDCFKDAVKAAWSHRTAHQAAPAPKQSDITGRQLFTDWTESNGGLMKGGYGFLNPTAKREWEYCAQRINQASQSMRLALIRAFFTLEWISSRVDGIDQPAIEYRMKDITATLGTTEGDLWDLGFSDDDMKGSQG